jgi:hypothetical protein
MAGLVLLAKLLFPVALKAQNPAVHHPQSTAPKVTSDTLKKSIPKEEHEFIGQAHLTLLYHAPSVRGRTIWGGLVPFGEVWVTGAHSATSLECDHDFVINGKTIAAGKYALFTIPGNEKWQVIVNKKWDQHLADEYNPAEDVARIEVVPEMLGSHQERLKYTLVPLSEKRGSILIRWEKIRITVPIEAR